MDIQGTVCCCALALALTNVISCGGQVPVQATRVIQLETYRQRYALCEPGDANRLLLRTLGVENLCMLNDADKEEWNAMVADAQDNRFVVVGSARFMLALDPTNAEQFFVEGAGRHLVYQADSGELVASADYDIIDDGPLPISTLDEGSFVIGMHQRVTREFFQASPRCVHGFDLFAKVYVEKVQEGIYSLDYSREHEIGIPVVEPAQPWKSGDPVNVRTVGYMQLDGALDGRKILDLNDRHEMREDYLGILSKNQKSLRSSADRRGIYWCHSSGCEPNSDKRCEFVDPPMVGDICKNRGTR